MNAPTHEGRPSAVTASGSGSYDDRSAAQRANVIAGLEKVAHGILDQSEKVRDLCRLAAQLLRAPGSGSPPAGEEDWRAVMRDARQWVEKNTAQVRGLSAEAAAPGEAMLVRIDSVLASAPTADTSVLATPVPSNAEGDLARTLLSEAVELEAEAFDHAPYSLDSARKKGAAEVLRDVAARLARHQGSATPPVSGEELAQALAALAPFARVARGIPDDLPDSLWTHCESYEWDLSEEVYAGLKAKGIPLMGRSTSLNLWLDGYPLSDFRRAAQVYETLSQATPPPQAAGSGSGEVEKDAVDPIVERDAQEKHAEWMRRTGKELPALADRVFALRGTGYMGSGFGWDLERRLGRVIASVNDFEGDIWHGRKALASQVVAQLAVKQLYLDVAEAEQSRTTPTSAATVETHDNRKEVMPNEPGLSSDGARVGPHVTRPREEVRASGGDPTRAGTVEGVEAEETFGREKIAGLYIGSEEWPGSFRNVYVYIPHFRSHQWVGSLSPLGIEALTPSPSEGKGEVGEDEIADAIEQACHPDREGPYGLYDYTSHGWPKPHRVRDFRDMRSPSWGQDVLASDSREEAKAEFDRLTRLHPARAVLDLLSRTTPTSAGTVDGVDLKEACKPWEYHVGEPPDYESPLSAVYEAGADYALRMLARLVGVQTWTPAEAGESFECDFRGTLMNVLAVAGLYDDETGAWAKLPSPSPSDGKEEAIPAGWVLVPTLLTDAMLATLHDRVRIHVMPERRAAHILNEQEWWDAILEAAPQPPSPRSGGEGQGAPSLVGADREVADAISLIEDRVRIYGRYEDPTEDALWALYELVATSRAALPALDQEAGQ